MYGLDNNNIVREYHGNKEYLLNDTFLLRIENEEKAHYIYIKHIAKLFNKYNHVSGANKIMCPYGEK